VLVPVADREGGAPFKLEEIDLRAQLAAGRDLHTRILDALRALVFDTLRPARLVALVKLGPERPFVAAPDLIQWFFSYFDFPKLVDERALCSSIAEGTAECLATCRVLPFTMEPSLACAQNEFASAARRRLRR
jgi:hypothetical protein